MAFFTDPGSVSLRGVFFRMTGGATLHRNRPKGTFTQMAFGTLYLKVFTRPREPSFTLMIETRLGVEAIPTLGIVAPVAAIKIGTFRFAMIIAMAFCTLGNSPQVAVSTRLGAFGSVTVATPHLAVFAL